MKSFEIGDRHTSTSTLEVTTKTIAMAALQILLLPALLATCLQTIQGQVIPPPLFENSPIPGFTIKLIDPVSRKSSRFFQGGIMTARIEQEADMIAWMIDSENFGNAEWVPFRSNIPLNLGHAEGTYKIYVGLMDLDSGFTRWTRKVAKIDRTPPQVILEEPISEIVSISILQIIGHCSEEIMGVSYDYQNAKEQRLNKMGFKTAPKIASDGSKQIINNRFLCVDIPLAEGYNEITLRVTDWAGNTTTKSYTCQLDYDSDKTPPELSPVFPFDNQQIPSDIITMTGYTEPCTKVIALGPDGIKYKGRVGRKGDYYIPNVRVSQESEIFKIIAWDPAGNMASVEVKIAKAPISVEINEIKQNKNGLFNIRGSVNKTHHTMRLNGK